MSLLIALKMIEMIPVLGFVFLRFAEYGSVFGYYFFDLNMSLKDTLKYLWDYVIGINHEDI